MRSTYDVSFHTTQRKSEEDTPLCVDLDELDANEEHGQDDGDEAPNSGWLDPDQLESLSPRSRRKRKNRDQMRAARRRERETMERLRTMVEGLETKHRRLQDRNNQSESGDTRSVANTVLLPAAYADLISLKSHFQEENFHLKQVLYDKGKLRQTLERHVSDLVAPTHEELQIMRQDLSVDVLPSQSSPVADPEEIGYTALSPDTVWTIVGEAHRRMAVIQQSIHRLSPWTNHNHGHSTITVHSPFSAPCESRKSSTPKVSTAGIPCNQETTHANNSPSASPPMPHSPLPPFCGWDVHHQCEANDLRFSFEKQFPHVAAHEAMTRMWTNELAMNTYRDPRVAQHEHQTMRLVQEISDDAYVFQRRLGDPETQRVVVSTYVRFRMRTSQGLLIGLVSMRDPCTMRTATAVPTTSNVDDDDEEEEEEEEGKDSDGNGSGFHHATKACVYTEFLPIVGDAGCHVRILGTTNMDSPTNAQRHVADVIIGLLRWENLNIGPVFALTDG